MKYHSLWIRIPSRHVQIRFGKCKTCGREMYRTRPTGANYAIHNPHHYWLPVCEICGTGQHGAFGHTNPVKLAEWKRLAETEGVCAGTGERVNNL